MNAKKC